MPLNILDLIGDLANGAYGQPQANPNVGQSVDGQVVPPWKTPGFFSRAFSPLAQQAIQANMAYMQNPALYQQQTQELTGRAGTFDKEPVGIKQGLAGMGDWNAGNVSEEQQRQADTSQNVFGKRATAEGNVAGMQSTQNDPTLYPNVLKNLQFQTGPLTAQQDISELYKAKHPFIGAGSPYDIEVDPSGQYLGYNPLSPTAPYMGHFQMGNTQTKGGTNINYPIKLGGPNDQGGTTSSVPVSANSPAPYRGVQPEDTRSLLGQLGHAVTSPISSGLSYAKNALGGVGSIPTALLGSPAATAPTEQEVDAARNQILSQGKRLHMVGGYEVDKDGNVYKDGKFIPDEAIKGLPIEKMRNAIMSFHKAGKEHLASTALHNQ